jgi:Tol biopolymer transport system component
MNPDGSNVKAISIRGGSPSWAPNGGKIAFLGPVQGLTFPEAFVVDTLGQGLQRLTENSADDRWVSWSSDSTRIAFESQPEGQYPSIWMMNADGSNKSRLGSGQTPDWSPDSRRIVFVAPDNFNNEVLWIMNADGTGKKQLTFSKGKLPPPQ